MIGASQHSADRRTARLKISCITTVFNEGDLVRRSIGSLLSQTHRDIEVIIVDDGSADATRSVLESITDPRVLLIRQANDGLSAARNKALEQVTGDYVCFLDADDYRPAWALAAIADACRRDAPDIVFCRGTLSELGGTLLPFYDTPQIQRLVDRLDGSPADRGAGFDPVSFALIYLLEPQVANKAVRTAFLRENRLSFPNNHFFEDILFHTRAIAAADRISVLDTLAFTYFRRYQAQITATRGETRFDVIGVARLTLEMFADQPGFRDPLQRAAVLASTVKLVRWCGDVISHHHRFAFNQLVQVLFRAIDPAYREFPNSVPPGLDEIVRAWDYLDEHGILETGAVRPATSETDDERTTRPGLLQRLWRTGRA